MGARVLKTLRRLLRPVKTWLLRVVEFRRGVMLGLAIAEDRSSSKQAPNPVRRMEALPTDYPLRERKVLQRFREGHSLYGIIIEGSLITYAWVSGPGAVVGVLHAMLLNVPERSIYIWDGFTRPDHRSRGLLQNLLRGIIEQEPGINMVYAAVDLNNAPSIRALEKTGFESLFRYYGLKLFNRPVLALARTSRGFGPAKRCFDGITGKDCFPGENGASARVGGDGIR